MIFEMNFNINEIFQLSLKEQILRLKKFFFWFMTLENSIQFFCSWNNLNLFWNHWFFYFFLRIESSNHENLLHDAYICIIFYYLKKISHFRILIKTFLSLYHIKNYKSYKKTCSNRININFSILLYSMNIIV